MQNNLSNAWYRWDCMGHMFLLMPIYYFQVKCSRLLAHSDPKKGLLGHGCKDCLWFSVLQVWALCKLLQTCWRGWCPRCWFPPGVTSHHLQSRGILECVNWSCRPAAASLPPGRVLEKKTKILNDGATTRNWDEMSSKSKIKDGDSRVSFFFFCSRVSRTFFTCLHPSLPPPAKQKQFSVRLFLSYRCAAASLPPPPPPQVCWAPCSSEPWLLRYSESKWKTLLHRGLPASKTEGHEVCACGQFLCPDNHALSGQLISDLRAACRVHSAASAEKKPFIWKQFGQKTLITE